MSLSKKELQDIKNKLKQSNPNLINSIKKRTTTIKNTEADEQSSNRYKSPKRQIKWNFSVNDIVEVVKRSSDSHDIGLIVSDYIYHSSKVEKNNFFVLVNNTVGKYDGRYLRKL